jgi:serine/threonine-protein kinase
LFLSESRSAPLKILDFGLANAGHEPAPADEGEVAIVGTPEYMAPEQARPGEIDERADLYALGCVLYELCTGHLPFTASSPVALAELKGRCWPPPMRDRASALRLPESLDRVLMKLLSPLPADRYTSARELRRALEQVQRAPVRRRTTSRWIGYAMIATTSLFGLVAVGATRSLPLPSSARPLMPEDAAEPVLAVVPGAATATVTPTPPSTAIPTAVVNATPNSSSGAQRRKASRVNDKLGAAAPLRDVAGARAHAETAAAARDWNEAVQAAEAWALIDSSVEPRLYLARMLSYSGRNRAAVRILENLLEAHPECDEARALLSDFRGSEVPVPASSARAERAETGESPTVP